MFAPRELESIAALADPAVRRAALEGFHPGVMSTVAGAVVDPGLLGELDAEVAAVAVSCLAPHDAMRAAALDQRPAVRTALAEVCRGMTLHVTAPSVLSSRGAQVPTGVLVEWVRTGQVGVGDAVAWVRGRNQPGPCLAVVVAALECTADGGTGGGVAGGAEEELLRALFQDVMWGRIAHPDGPGELGWARAGELAPAAWWHHGGPLNAYGAEVLWAGVFAAGWMAEVVDGCGLDEGATSWLLAQVPASTGPGATRRLFSDQLVLIDRAAGAAGLCGAVSLTPLADEALAALGLLGHGPTRAALRAALAAGDLGEVHNPAMLGALESLALDPDELSGLLGESVLGPWALSVDPAQWRPVLELCDPQVVDSALEYDGWADDPAARDAFCEAAVDVCHGMLVLLGEWAERPLVGAIMSRLSDGLGADAMAWQALWTLAERWPSTVDSAIRCVAACQRPPTGR